MQVYTWNAKYLVPPLKMNDSLFDKNIAKIKLMKFKIHNGFQILNFKNSNQKLNQ